LPIDDDIIWRLFGDEVAAGEIPHPMAITDVWKNSYSENTSRKIWAAKYVARHPNLVALELSSFKCGHDAPIYTVGGGDRRALRHALLLLQGHRRKQADGSIKIRVETIGYFLKRYREDMIASKGKEKTIEQRLQEFEERLRRQLLNRRPLGSVSDERLIRDSFEQGALPEIHVSVAALAASRPPAPAGVGAGD
jgi:hypothetical protein